MAQLSPDREIDADLPRASRGVTRVAPPVRHALLTGAAAACILLAHGFYTPPIPVPLVHLAQFLLLSVYWLDVVTHRLDTEPGSPLRAIGPLRLGLLAVFIAGAAAEFAGAGQGALTIDAVGLLLFLLEIWRLNIALSRWLASPSILFPSSFAALIAVGTVVIKAPVATPPDQPISWLDALFTMTSAVCITGLAVRDIAAGFTPLGQGVICLFIQLGGLGIIYFGSVLALLLGRTLSLREDINLSQSLSDLPLGRLTSFARFVLVATLAIELVGATLLFFLWEAPAGVDLSLRERIGRSVFYAVSGFCNAGFDLTGASMIPFRSHLTILTVFMALVALGSLGFPAMHDIFETLRWRASDFWRARRKLAPIDPWDRSRRRLNLTTRLVLITTASLYALGALGIAAGQVRPAFVDPDDLPRPMSAGQVLLDSAFMSVSGRTAGFNSLPMDEIAPTGQFVLTSLMLVGGSPGSTAGGVKTTVLAVLVLSVVATIRQRRQTEVFGRTISDALVRRAGTLGLCYILLVAVGVFLLTLTEPAPLERIVFEVVSAVATTGLSLGLTPELTPAGKWVIIAMMFLGRVGPLALVGALVFRREPPPPYAYPHETVALG